MEEAIIISKTLSDKKALDFFNNMIDPPNISSIISAVNNLKISGFLDKDENFTSLGERVSYISLQLNLSKAAVLSCVLQYVKIYIVARRYSYFSIYFILHIYVYIFKKFLLYISVYFFRCLNPVLSIITTFSSFNGHTLSLNEISSPSRVLKEKTLEFHETSDHIGILKYFQHMKYSDNNSLFAAMQDADQIDFKKVFDVTQSKSVIHVCEEK